MLLFRLIYRHRVHFDTGYLSDAVRMGILSAGYRIS